ncbi:MAG TPA: restriction endonuclease subunit S [Candidatus Kryptonia bacterium]
MKNNDVKRVVLGDVLHLLLDEVPVDPLREYMIAGVYSFARGLLARGPLAGSSTTYKKLNRLHRGDFVISEPKAWEGAIAKVTESFDGWYVSPVFPTFRADSEQLDINYLDWYCKQSNVWERLRFKSRGIGARRETVSPDQFLSIEIPLPPLENQRRIVARIEGLAAKIKEVRKLRDEALAESSVLLDAYFEKLISSPSTKMKLLSEVAEINPRLVGASVLEPSKEVSFVPMSAVDDVSGKILHPVIKKCEEVWKGHTRFQNGDVIFARITPCMQNGKSALAHDLVNGLGFGSTEFHVIRPRPEVSGKWIWNLVRLRSFRDDAASHFKGSAGQQRVPEMFLEQKLIPVPPIEAQNQITDKLDEFEGVLNKLVLLQHGTTRELEAILPSVLDKAFKGEL